MRVLLVSANTERLTMPTPPLGAAMVAAATRRHGHEVELVDLLGSEDPSALIHDAVQRIRPQVIGISVRNIDDQNRGEPSFLLARVEEVVRACREASAAPLVLGGAGYSIFPAAALDYLGADYGIAGEGELAFPALLEDLDDPGDPSPAAGIYVRGQGQHGKPNGPANLDELPSPYDDLEPSLDPGDPELWVPVQTRRGCPLDCSYCSTPQIEGRATRQRSPELVIKDLTRLAAAGFKRIHFVDNTFNLPPSYALDLCRRMAALGLPFAWRCIVYPHGVSAELVDAMTAAGCAEVAIGFESGSDRILGSLNKRFSSDDVRRTTDLFAATGIARIGFLLLGVPGETRESVSESLDFADSLDLTTLKVTIGVRIYPQTPVARFAAGEGVISAGDNLLRPRFYLAPAVEGWVEEAVSSRSWSVPLWM